MINDLDGAEKFSTSGAKVSNGAMKDGSGDASGSLEH